VDEGGERGLEGVEGLEVADVGDGAGVVEVDLAERVEAVACLSADRRDELLGGDEVAAVDSVLSRSWTGRSAWCRG
jgi:hypothetical protein